MTQAKKEMTQKQRNKWTRDPIRGKSKRNTTPISGDTTFDSVSNGWSFVIFYVIHLIFLVMKYSFENLYYIYIWGNDFVTQIST